MERRELDAIPLTGDVSLRQRAIVPERTALLLVDLQNGQVHRTLKDAHPGREAFFDRVRGVVVPNGRRLLAACRGAGMEVVFTVIESLTLDGRDRGLDHKISGIFAARGSWEAQVIDELRPEANEVVLPKTSSSLFNSTAADYVLKNLGIDSLMVMGVVTDQCVESAVRDGCDRGFMVTLVEDGCAAWNGSRHAESLRGLAGYCRLRSTDQLIGEIERR